MFNWCPGGDSNSHAIRRYHLKIVCLPIPPPGHSCFCIRNTPAWQVFFSGIFLFFENRAGQPFRLCPFPGAFTVKNTSKNPKERKGVRLLNDVEERWQAARPKRRLSDPEWSRRAVPLPVDSAFFTSYSIYRFVSIPGTGRRSRRQPRQVRKEATVTVVAGCPVPKRAQRCCALLFFLRPSFPVKAPSGAALAPRSSAAPFPAQPPSPFPAHSLLPPPISSAAGAFCPAFSCSRAAAATSQETFSPPVPRFNDAAPKKDILK